MAQLAKDMGSAPSLRALWTEYGSFVTFLYWFVLLSSATKDNETMELMYSFGAAFPTFYRLVGPYRSEKAEGIVKTELWDTIKRRGVIGNIFMGVIPMVRFVSITTSYTERERG